MAETIMGASGQNLWQITAGGAGLITGSVELSNSSINVDVTVSDYVSIIGSPNYRLPVIGSAEASNLLNPHPITGSVHITGGSVEVNVQVSDYLSIIGSPNYSLPVIGSVQVSSITGALPAGTALLGSVIASPVGTQVVSATDLDIRDLATSDYVSIVGSPNYRLPVIGSVEVSNSINVAITTDDYISIVGSPNYSLPVIGSVEISTIRTMPTTTVTATNLDIRDLSPTQDYVSIIGSPSYNLPTTGSVQVSSIVANVGVTQQTSPWVIIGSTQTSNLLNPHPVIGSVEVSNNINVAITTDDYISIVGSPNYSLPIIGSVEISTIRTMPTTTVTATNLDIRDLTSASDSVAAVGSVQVSSIVGALPAGTAILGSVKIEDGGNTITVDGTVTANLAAGTNLIGSVVADIVGLSTSDYLSIVGSPNYSLPVIGSMQVSSIVGALPTGTNSIGNIGSIGAGVLGSVEVSSIRTFSAWTGIGSVTRTIDIQDGSSITFDFVGPVTGSVLGIPATGSRFNITDAFCNASGQGIVTLFFNADNTSNRIAKAALANFGGFVQDYAKPLRGPTNGSLMITTAATGFTPVGFLTINLFQSA